MTTQAFAIVPAAGVGRRMGGSVPKQYLPLASSLVIDHTLTRLLEHPRIQLVVVAVGSNDEWWPGTRFANNPKILTVHGGIERCHSVHNALSKLANIAAENDWVLVHDAVRPCLRAIDIDKLLQRLDTSPVGGLLGVPVHDTMKRTDGSGMVLATVPRADMWHAYTPQMFRFHVLWSALTTAIQKERLVTDEAEAVELLGLQPIVVEGHKDNIKITHAEDLALAEFWLSQPGR